MELELTNKVALVTASRSGLGFATAKQLLLEGSNVAVCGRSMSRLEEAYAELLKQHTNKISLFKADLSNQNDIQQMVASVVERFSQLDIVVTNCSGPRLMSFEESKTTDWENSFNHLLMSCVATIRASIPFLKNSEAPSILTITSITAKQPSPNFLLSNVFRPAIIGLTKTLSQELGPYNIRVNSILPGFTMTERLVEAMTARANKANRTLEEQIKTSAQSVPLRRIGEPHEFAKTAVFLVSPAAGYINGVSLQVDGGLNQGLF